MRWVTSDTHFGHANILEYCPWRKTWAGSIEEHDQKLIEAWNACVAPDDVVYHLGDFALVKRQRIKEFRDQLHGTIVLILGNHDRSGMATRGFLPLKHAVFAHNGLNIVCRHMPEAFRSEEYEHADLLLHGHAHGNPARVSSDFPAQYRHKLIDVGIDARLDIHPISLDELCAKRERR